MIVETQDGIFTDLSPRWWKQIHVSGDSVVVTEATGLNQLVLGGSKNFDQLDKLHEALNEGLNSGLPRFSIPQWFAQQ